jgi:predicted hydrocarbon binding protein
MLSVCEDNYMKCSKPFILAYNRLFLFLHDRGYDELVEFWALLEDAILGRLRYLAMSEGLVGMLKYWSETLTAEGADFDIELTNSDEFALVITIYECPSICKIKESEEPVCDVYCNHCREMYTRALQKVGYKFEVITTEKGCMIRVVQ